MAADFFSFASAVARATFPPVPREATVVVVDVYTARTTAGQTRYGLAVRFDPPDPDTPNNQIVVSTLNEWAASLARRAGGAPLRLHWRDTQWGPELVGLELV